MTCTAEEVVNEFAAGAAWPEGGPSPTDVVVCCDDGESFVWAAHDFNRDDGGWEAVWAIPDRDPVSLVDGPGFHATATEVAEWLKMLAADPEGHTD